MVDKYAIIYIKKMCLKTIIGKKHKMYENKDNIDKFPSTLKNGFEKYNICFPKETEWQYEKIFVYRMVLRNNDDYSRLEREDFSSHAELGIIRRGHEEDVTKYDYYGASFFIDRKVLANKLKFPKPGKKIAEGNINDSYGPVWRNLPHICLWLYDKVDLTNNDFVVKDYE